MSRLARLLPPLAAVLVASAAVSPAQPVGEAAGALDDRTVLNPLAEVSLDALSGFRDRPLFTASRRPPAPPVVESDPVVETEPTVDEPVLDVVEEAPAVTLSGILEVDAEAVAMLRDDASGTTRAVRVGDPVESWTVAAIGVDSVTLELEGREHAIRIFQPGSAGGPATGDEAVDPIGDPEAVEPSPGLDDGLGAGEEDLYDPATGEGDPYATAVGDGADDGSGEVAPEDFGEDFGADGFDPALDGADPMADEGGAFDDGSGGSGG